MALDPFGGAHRRGRGAHRARRIASLIVPALLLAAPRAPAVELGDFTGTWVRAETATDDAAREAEILRATEPMSVLVRGIARAVMRRSMRPAERHEIRTGAGAPEILSSPGGVYRIDGAEHGDVDGSVRTRFTADGAIEQTWAHGNSRGTTLWRLEPEGTRLIVRQRVTVERLDTTMEYADTYRRVSADP